MLTDWHVWVCWDLIPGGFEKSLPGFKSTLSSGSEQMPAIFFSCPNSGPDWGHLLGIFLTRCISRQATLHGEFGNRKGRTFSGWVRLKTSIIIACQIYLQLARQACSWTYQLRGPSSQVIWCVVFSDSWAMSIFVYISTCSVHSSGGSVVGFEFIELLNSSFNWMQQTFSVR